MLVYFLWAHFKGFHHLQFDYGLSLTLASVGVSTIFTYLLQSSFVHSLHIIQVKQQLDCHMFIVYLSIVN
eukprot:c16951_g1_i1 orf=300-509(-)